MSEETIERLNFYNGQRLEADDFRLEQEYHIRIQRWLSKSLFSPGVAEGLEVAPIADPQTGKKSRVRVTAGLALDDLGRAIISLEPVVLVPQAQFLCVRYAERKARVEQGNCGAQDPASELARWGGPARIVSEAEFVWRSGFPQRDAREIVIAVLQLAPDCTVEKILSGPKRRAVATQHVATPYAIAGEKDIDQNNPKTIYFHTKNYAPQVFLHLRASQFSTLHYSEMAEHSHQFILKNAANAPKAPGTITSEANVGHQHDLTDARTSSVAHTHEATANLQHWKDVAYNSWDPGPLSQTGCLVIDKFNSQAGDGPTANIGDSVFPMNLRKVDLVITSPSHDHELTATTELSGVHHTHELSIDKWTESLGAAGPIDARAGAQLTFPGNLAIWFIRKGLAARNITQDIFDGYLKTSGSAAWLDPGVFTLGDRSATHPLVTEGTGPIPLHSFVDIEPGESAVVISVGGPGNGGCVHYNLYIE